MKKIDFKEVMEKVDGLLSADRGHGHTSKQIETLAKVLIDEINARLEHIEDQPVPVAGVPWD